MIRGTEKCMVMDAETDCQRLLFTTGVCDRRSCLLWGGCARGPDTMWGAGTDCSVASGHHLGPRGCMGLLLSCLLPCTIGWAEKPPACPPTEAHPSSCLCTTDPRDSRMSRINNMGERAGYGFFPHQTQDAHQPITPTLTMMRRMK